MVEKQSIWIKIDFALFILGLIITLISVVLALNNNSCEGNTDTTFGLIIITVCTFGLKGAGFVVALILTILFLVLFFKLKK